MAYRRGGAVTPYRLANLGVSLDIGRAARPFLRDGLTNSSAQALADIVRRMTGVDAVAITDRQRVLGFVGEGCYRFKPGSGIQTEATRRAILTGNLTIVQDKEALSCPEEGCPCPLNAAVIAPLYLRGEVVGTAKLYRQQLGQVDEALERLAAGVAELLSIHLELGEADRQRELLVKAKLEALSAQIQPHFLFNVLNTIIGVSRSDGEAARALLLELADFFRHTLAIKKDYISLSEEMDFIRSYLLLETARYPEQVSFRLRIEKDTLAVMIPRLLLQPLVENALKHGLQSGQQSGGIIWVSARTCQEEVFIYVGDNGRGVEPEDLDRIFEPGVAKGLGVGLHNVRERLWGLYGRGLRIKSWPGRGTLVLLRIPKERLV